jgi:hypothetical protein
MAFRWFSGKGDKLASVGLMSEAGPINLSNLSDSTCSSSGLEIRFEAPRKIFKQKGSEMFRATYSNVGLNPISLTFWWNRFIEINHLVSPTNTIQIVPSPGPVLPCGGGDEYPITIQPGENYVRDEYLGCTQPAGEPNLGWSYNLNPGDYTAKLHFAVPAIFYNTPSNFGVSPPSSWQGYVVSNTIEFSIIK